MSRCDDRYINRTGQVMGEFGIPRIALRGPGCINGTGRCNVRGAQGRCTNVYGTGELCNDDVAGTGGRRRCDDDFVAGTGGRCRCDDDVAGTGGRRRCNNVAGTGGRRRCDDDVAGTGGRRRCNWNCCDWIWHNLETPTIVPR